MAPAPNNLRKSLLESDDSDNYLSSGFAEFKCGFSTSENVLLNMIV
jgi:hypothetical protein